MIDGRVSFAVKIDYKCLTNLLTASTDYRTFATARMFLDC